MPGIYNLDFGTLATADSTTTPALTSNGWTTAPAIIDDYRIEGSNALYGRASNTTAWTGFQVGTLNLSTGDEHLFVWINNLAPSSTDTKARGGVAVWLSSGNTTFVLTGTTPNDGDAASKNWFVNGQDTDGYGGYKCYAFDPRGTPTVTIGSPDLTSVQLIGIRNKTVSAIANGRYSMAWDALRIGTGVTITSGSDAAPVTFTQIFQSGSLITGSNSSAFGIVSGAWGVLTNFGGTFYGAAKLRFGSSTQTTNTRFKDTAQSLVWQSYPVSSSFYEILITGSTTRNTQVQFGELISGVPSNGCTISAPSGSVWNLTVNPSPSASQLIAYASQFSQMRAGTIRTSGSILQNCSFSGCGTLLVSASTLINNTTFSNNVISFGSSSFRLISASLLSTITDNSFVGNYIAMELTTAGTHSFNGLNFSNNTYDIWNSSGGAILINATDSNPSDLKILNSAGSSTTIVNTVTLTLTGLISGSEVRIYSSGTTTELTGIENSDTTFQYAYNYSPSTLVDIVVHNVEYVYYRVDGYELGSANGSLPIQQSFDRNYSNP